MRIAANLRRSRLIPVASLFVLLAFVGVRSSVAASSEEEIKVLANLPLKDMHVNQMFAQQEGDKYYLYLHRTDEDAYALVDVTKPSKPALVSANAIKGSAAEGTVGPSPVVIATTQEGGATKATAETPTQTVNLVDTSVPKAPKTVKTFKGVTSMYSDTGRKLVYIVNGEGLWVVSHRHAVPICSGTDCAAAFHP